MLILAIICVLFWNVFTAWVHSRLRRVKRRHLKNGKNIRHGWWGALYCGIVAALIVLTNQPAFAVFALLIRKPVFDIALSLFSGLPAFYTDPDPESIIDDIHLSLFGDRSEIYQTVYFFAAWLSLTLLTW